MKKMMISAAAAVAMLAGAASADVALDSANLDEVTAGSAGAHIDLSANVNKYIRNDIRSRVSARGIRGTTAAGFSQADCFGRNCFAESFTVTVSDKFGAQSVSEALSQTNTSYKRRKRW